MENADEFALVKQPCLVREHVFQNNEVLQHADIRPAAALQRSRTDSEKRADAAAMSDLELVTFLARRLQPLTEEVWTLLPYIREARARFSQPGRRVPIRGKPTFTAWIQTHLGISDRHVRRILAAAGSATDIATARALVGAKDKKRRDELRTLTIRLACGVFGLDEPENDDIGGIQHKRALQCIAAKVLNMIRLKPVTMHLGMPQLPQGDVSSLFGLFLKVFDPFVEQVLDGMPLERREEVLSEFFRQVRSRHVSTARMESFDSPGAPPPYEASVLRVSDGDIL